jgi:ribonucleoside-diphosphate reductase alpha chain
MLAQVTRLRPSRTRRAVTEDFDLGGLSGRLTITELPDGRPGEVFLMVGKQGSTLAGVCEALSLMTSLALQYQVPLVEVVRRLINMRFEPAGLTGVADIPFAVSIADYLGRRLAMDFLASDDREQLGIASAGRPAQVGAAS